MVEHEIYVNPARVLQARQWLWDVSQDILTCRNKKRWTPNERACHQWNRVCEYYPLCEVEANGGDPSDLLEQDYRVSDPHPELVTT